jgi:hypothetical protein
MCIKICNMHLLQWCHLLSFLLSFGAFFKEQLKFWASILDIFMYTMIVVMVCVLCTGHCHLHAHLYCLGVSHTTDCACETGLHTPEYILQYCPKHQEPWDHFWPPKGPIEKKLGLKTYKKHSFLLGP